MKPEYIVDGSEETWWRNSHDRPATYLYRNQGDSEFRHVCDPQKSGILLPCSTEKLNIMAEE